ncbi:unnamed protein product [Phytomonas sp. EM1]|nr:unnamed protein product [Phytomonas sp. EM1]|eukprot:CCW59901.1 unnamed protein product [Phytomonas sp. isolate EM1]
MMRFFIILITSIWFLALAATICTLPLTIDILTLKVLHIGVSHGQIRVLKALDYIVNLTRYTDAFPSPFYTLATADLKDETGKEIFGFLVQKSFDVNADASYNAHPLTTVYRKNRPHIAIWFITQPNIIAEVYMEKLTCYEASAVHPNITLVLEHNEIRRCAYQHPRISRYASSKLKSHYEAIYKQPQPSPMINGIGPTEGVPDAEWWKYTARNLHPLSGTIDQPWTVINPAYFHDFSSVLLFYVFSQLENTMNILVLVAALVFSLIWFSSWIRVLSW